MSLHRCAAYSNPRQRRASNPNHFMILGGDGNLVDVDRHANPCTVSPPCVVIDSSRAPATEQTLFQGTETGSARPVPNPAVIKTVTVTARLTNLLAIL